MRVGLVSCEYPPQLGLGGVGTYTFRLAEALGLAGCDVSVLCGPTETHMSEIPLKNVTVHRQAAYYDPPWRVPGVRFLWWRAIAPFLERSNRTAWHWIKWNLASGEALQRVHARTPLDVIEAPEHAANGLLVGSMRQWPTVIRLHGPWDLFFGINATQGTALNRLLTWMEHRSCRYADVLTAPSKTMAAFMHERWRLRELPTPAPNFMNVPEEPAPLPSPSDVQRIVCAGRLERFKGQDTLVKAFARIGAKHPSAELHLLGPDQWDHRYSFSQLVDRLVPDPSVRKRVILTGPVPLAMVQQALRGAAIAVICSSGFESFSFSTLEAMAAARPIVASRVGALPELLDNGRCGLTAAPGNPQHVADALETLLTNRPLCERLSLAAHTRAKEHYDTQAAIPLFLAAYEQAQQRFRKRKGGPAIVQAKSQSLQNVELNPG
jgi:glycosyltransferase involved in cell wall biosynthesis